MDRAEVGFQAYVSDSSEEFGAIREVSRDGQQLTVYVENAGEFYVPVGSVLKVAYGKVTFDCKKLAPAMRAAIGHAHDEEQL